jgi:hypothetical protein
MIGLLPRSSDFDVRDGSLPLDAGHTTIAMSYPGLFLLVV